MNVNEILNERCQLYSDFYNNKLPKRIPISVMLPHSFLADRVGVSLKDIQFNFNLIKDECSIVCDELYSDANPISPAGDTALYNYILGSKTMIMSDGGFMQHPEVSGMNADEYDEFINDPYACIVEKIIPRLYKNLDPAKPYDMMKAFAVGTSSLKNECDDFNANLMAISQRKGYYPGAPRGSRGHLLAPFDFLADQCRSFSGISMDIRRNPNKVKDACEAIYPYIFKLGLPTNPHPEGSVSTPLHMPTFMREKDFVNIWLPTYKRLLQEFASLGVRVSAFLEDDWTRYYDIIQSEFPAGTMLRIEYGDFKTIKEKLGNKFIIGQMYPLEVLRDCSKQQAIDKAKEMLDIMMPGGGYMFGFSKFPLNTTDVNFDNMKGLFEFIRDYAVYPNAGESYGIPLNSENFKFDLSSSTSLKSKYSFNWSDFKNKNPYTPDFVQNKLELYEADVMKFYLGLFD